MTALKTISVSQLLKYAVFNSSVNDRRSLFADYDIFSLESPNINPFLHSEAIDRILGMRIQKIESDLLQKAKRQSPEGTISTWSKTLHKAQTWIGLPEAIINTPYSEFRALIPKLDIPLNGRIIDFGAGYGRLGHVLHQLRPDLSYVGIELVPERLEEANRLFQEFGCSRAIVQSGNLALDLDIDLKADVYFSYDFGSHEDMRSAITTLLRKHTAPHTFVARGAFIQQLILSEFKEYQLKQTVANFHLFHYDGSFSQTLK